MEERAADVWAKAGMIVKVKEPIEREYQYFKEGLLLYTYLHLAADGPLTRALLDAKVAAVAYETAAMEEKDYASVLAGAPRHGYYGQCTYCGHCAPCPAGIDIAMVNKLYDLALMQEELPASLKAHYDQLSANADACIGCKSCESRCPFGVKIAERMARTKEHFKG